jgi:hypothetical protein
MAALAVCRRARKIPLHPSRFALENWSTRARIPGPHNLFAGGSVCSEGRLYVRSEQSRRTEPQPNVVWKELSKRRNGEITEINHGDPK